MKTIFTLLLLAAYPCSLPAQEVPEALPAQTAPGTSEANPASLIPEPPPLIPRSPERSRTGDKVPSSPEQAFRKTKTGVAVSDIEQRVRFRKAKTRALQAPGLQEIKDEAYAAATEREKRAGLKEYYTALFARMAKIDSSLKKEIETKKRLTLARLDQTRLRELGADEALFESGE